MRDPTEEEQVVIDLILAGVSEFDVPDRIGISWAEYEAWYGDPLNERAALIRQAKRAYRDSKERLPPEERAEHAGEAIRRFKQKVIDDEVDRIIRQSQK